MTDPDPQKALDKLLAREVTFVRCRARQEPSAYERLIQRQDEIETGSQVVGADDEWA